VFQQTLLKGLSCWAQRSISCAGRFARRDCRCFAALSM